MNDKHLRDEQRKYLRKLLAEKTHYIEPYVRRDHAAEETRQLLDRIMAGAKATTKKR